MGVLGRRCAPVLHKTGTSQRPNSQKLGAGEGQQAGNLRAALCLCACRGTYSLAVYALTRLNTSIPRSKNALALAQWL
jgi:hypothetical protein